MAADFCGPYSRGSDEEMRFVLVIVDHFTKWVELIPTRTQEAKEVAQAFYDRIICRQGCPRRFLTDNGAAFQSHLVENLCALFKITKIYSSAYYPQGDGTAERFMQSLNNSLAILSRHHPEDWPKYVPGVAFAYNTSVHSSTGQSPFFLNTGRVPSFPEEGWIREINGEESQGKYSKWQYKEYLESMRETISHAQSHARQALESTWLKMSKRYKPDTKKIEIGDKVLIRLTDAERDKFPIRKLAPRWSEPSIVRGVLCNGKTFQVEREGTMIVVNRERLIKLPPQTRLAGFAQQSTPTHTEEKVATEEAAGESEDEYWSASPRSEGTLPMNVERTSSSQRDEPEAQAHASTSSSGVEVIVSASSGGPSSSEVSSVYASLFPSTTTSSSSSSTWY